MQSESKAETSADSDFSSDDDDEGWDTALSESESDIYSDSSEASNTPPKKKRQSPNQSKVETSTKRTRKSTPAPKYDRPIVSSLPLDGKDDAKRLNVSPEVLNRMLSIAKIAMNPGTEAEGRNAEHVLSKYLVKHAIDRSCFEELMKPSTQQDLLKEAARFQVRNSFARRPAWVDWLGNSVSVLFQCGSYVQGSQDVIFYGEADMANSAAELFADLFVSVSELSASYNKRTPGISLGVSRESYRRGLVTGFKARCENVIEQRKAYVKKLQEDAAERERAARERAERLAEIAEKARIQREKARIELQAAVSDVAGITAENTPLSQEFRLHIGTGDSDDEVLFRTGPPKAKSRDPRKRRRKRPTKLFDSDDDRPLLSSTPAGSGGLSKPAADGMSDSDDEPSCPHEDGAKDSVQKGDGAAEGRGAGSGQSPSSEPDVECVRVESVEILPPHPPPTNKCSKHISPINQAALAWEHDADF
jgi:hypothetical protein